MVSAVKARVGKGALKTVRAALQLHGAIGYTDEHDIGIYYKRARWRLREVRQRNHPRRPLLRLDAAGAGALRSEPIGHSAEIRLGSRHRHPDVQSPRPRQQLQTPRCSMRWPTGSSSSAATAPCESLFCAAAQALLAGAAIGEGGHPKRDIGDVCALVDATPKPTIAVVQGACIGGAVALASCCDVMVASREAIFSIPEVRLGFAPGPLIGSFLRAIRLHARCAAICSRVSALPRGRRIASGWCSNFAMRRPRQRRSMN